MTSVRHFSLYKSRALDPPEPIRRDFESLETLSARAERELAEAEAKLFPPVFDAKRRGPLSDSDLAEVARRFQETKKAWLRAEEELPASLNLDEPPTKSWIGIGHDVWLG